ncbi:hypothetical protein CTAYLR_001360 [Chrysophaeum taylorii]|uniref:Uncharacterized protein n=1 Tax=Chrysophaeum taylorii TaxID=2483200 RepID=A0AAD7U629_9STRA|nr:hypothetical protein CTAYLR_001360 [Chrysophaeum taylorii]
MWSRLLGAATRATAARATYVPRTYPLSFSVAFTSVKTGAADYITQTYIERQDFDIHRNFAFWVFGAYFLGGVQYFFYVRVLGRWFPRAEAFALLPPRAKLKDTEGQRQVLYQLAVDMFLFEPFVYFPMFYQTKIRIQGGDGDDALRAYTRNIAQDIQNFWCVGVPAFLFNFTFCPMWLRIPFIAVYSFFWTCFLSFKRGNER